MAYSYKITALALSDVDDALSYIADKLSNPSAANRLYNDLRDAIDRICRNPFAFPDCSYFLIDDKNLRHTVVGNYVLIFEVAENDQLIRILRFLYGRRDITDMSIL